MHRQCTQEQQCTSKSMSRQDAHLLDALGAAKVCCAQLEQSAVLALARTSVGTRQQKIGGLDIRVADALPVALCQHLQDVMCCMRSLGFCHAPIVLWAVANQSALAVALALVSKMPMTCICLFFLNIHNVSHLDEVLQIAAGAQLCDYPYPVLVLNEDHIVEARLK